MATTPTFGWPTPDDTDLVRDGAAAIRAFGDAVDTTVSGIPVVLGIGSNVVQAVKTNVFTTSSTSFVDVPDLSATITPSSDDSKILVFAYLPMSNSSAGAIVGAQARILRGSTAVFIGDGDGSRTRSSAGFQGQAGNQERNVLSYTPVFVDDPGTDAPVTYKVQMLAGNVTAVLGRSGEDLNNAGTPRLPSSLVLIEVAA